MLQRLKPLSSLVILCLLAAAGVLAQEGSSVRITGLDSSDFPVIRINVLTADSQSAPLTDLSALSLRENGIPVGDLDVSDVVVGVNIIFVIDANASFDEIDPGSGLTRREKVIGSITRFSNQFMGAEDRVAIIVPDEAVASGRFLVQNAVSPEAVAGNLESYAPDDLAATPLNEMMLLALAHAADRVADGRFQAIMLFTDGAQIHGQLDYPTLVAQAQRIEVPIYVAILGERVDPNELENTAQLFEPTRATYAHMPEPVSTDPIYAAWRRQRTQTQISFRSLQTSSGRYPVTINLGAARAVTEYTLSIAPPDVTISTGDDQIRRIGDAPDTPLPLLEPKLVPLQILVRWPDNSPRSLATVNLFVDGQPQTIPSMPVIDDNGSMGLSWNIAGLDRGVYTLVVQLVDELGLSAVSEPLSIVIEVERPQPPAPTAIPTVVAVPITQAVEQEAPTYPDWLPMTLLAVAGLASLTLLRLRRRRKRDSPKPATVFSAESLPSVETPTAQVEAVPTIAFLEMLEAGPGHVARIRLEGDSVTVGRDHNVAQIVLAEESVSRLHARIKRREGQYWLYDEGSATGTLRNYQRLGLTPQRLNHRDTIHFGRVGARFHIQQVGVEEPFSGEIAPMEDDDPVPGEEPDT
jgi:hypothetical protein